MKYDLNNMPSYEHLQGTPHKAHEGSQSTTPYREKDPGGYTEMMVSSKQGKSLPEKSPGGMDYSDE
jgi:hypothetical protein